MRNSRQGFYPMYVCLDIREPPSHHHVRITQDLRMDLKVWELFLLNPIIFCGPFMDYLPLQGTDISMFSDASRNFCKGFGAYCGTQWSFGVWDLIFMERAQPSVEYLELFAVTVAVLNWIKLFQNCKIYLFCDNERIVHMLNKSSSS